MKKIQPYPTTDEQLVATSIDVKTDNITDVSIDAFWTLYDASGGMVDEGNYQLAGADFAAWQADKGYAETYVLNAKCCTLESN